MAGEDLFLDTQVRARAQTAIHNTFSLLTHVLTGISFFLLMVVKNEILITIQYIICLHQIK
jgi:hypothetical protein